MNGDHRMVVSLLLIEDEDPVANAILTGLEHNRQFRFVASRARDLRDCLGQGVADKDFDVCVFDLQLSSGKVEALSGLLAIGIRSFTGPGSLIVVYSAHDRPHLIVKAMKAGASDFISKADCAPHEFCARIEGLLMERLSGREKAEALDRVMQSHASEWREKYGGQVVAVVGERVVASGKCRLEALLEYLAARKTDPSLPEEPSYLGIPAKGGAQ